MKRITFLILVGLPLIGLGQQFEWVKQFAGPGYVDGIDISTDHTGNVVMVGNFSLQVDCDPGVDSAIATYEGYFGTGYVVKLNANGEYLWSAKQGHIEDFASVTHVATGPTGSIYIAGEFVDTVDFDPGPSEYNLFSDGVIIPPQGPAPPLLIADKYIIKLNSDGVFLWANMFDDAGPDEIHGLAVDPWDNLIVAATLAPSTLILSQSDTVDVGTEGSGAICRFTSNGNLDWVKRPGTPNYCVPKSIDVDDFGNIFTIGSFVDSLDFDPGTDALVLSSVDDQDVFFSKLDSTGALMWAKTAGGINDDQGLTVRVTTDNSAIALGSFKNSIDLDTILNADYQGYYTTDLFIVKMNQSGDFQWARQLQGMGYPSTCTMDVGNDDFPVIMGWSGVDSDLDPGTGSLTLGTAGRAFMLRLNESGSLDWAVGFYDGGGNAPVFKSLSIDNGYNIFSTGLFYATEDFDPSINTFNLQTSNGYSDGFVLKIGPDLVTNLRPMEQKYLSIYPNPTTSIINIQLPENHLKATRTIVYDIAGRLVHQNPYSRNMDVSFLVAGTYVVLVETEEGNYRGTIQRTR